MKSISNALLPDKSSRAPALPENGAQTCECSDLQPLFRPPLDSVYPLIWAKFNNPQTYTASQALHDLCETGRQRHDNAHYRAREYKNRLDLGERYLNEDGLSIARAGYETETATVKHLAFFERCWWEVSRDDIEAHREHLDELLQEAKARPGGWRYADLTVDDLISAFVEVSD